MTATRSRGAVLSRVPALSADARDKPRSTNKKDDEMSIRLTVHDGELKRYAVSVRCTSHQNIIWTSEVLVFATNTEDAKTAAVEKMIDKYLRHQSKRTTWIAVGEPEEC
jgi:hypothetical protein